MLRSREGREDRHKLLFCRLSEGNLASAPDFSTSHTVVNEEWNWVVSELEGVLAKTLTLRPDILELRTTRLIVVVATYAVGLQAARQLFPEERAQIIVDCTMAAVEAAYSDANAALLLAELDREWNKSLASQQNPLYAVGGVLFNLLRLEETMQDNGKTIMNPVAVITLSSIPVRLAGGGPRGSGQAWWKMCHDEFDILP